jgi:formamidopyrimidine-DNA glycosylase
MPELPDVEVYLRALRERVIGQAIERVRVASPFVVRSFDPPLRAIEGKRIEGLERLGKRLVWQLEDELFLVIHLMVAGRLRWLARGAPIPKKLGLAAVDLPAATVLLTEASKKKRASIHVVRSRAALAEHDPGGIEPFACSMVEFAAALRRENHTLKRSLTDPHTFSGIGNAYSDEILHRARLSPVQWTSRLSDDDCERLYRATLAVLEHWLARLDGGRAGGFPEKVTAFRDGMAVHGRYKLPCPDCGAPVQRIVRGDSEINYCATCQTGGKLLADRALSRLLHGDWPKTLAELDEMKRARAVAPSTPKPTGRGAKRRLLLFAHGAGAPSTSEWMAAWAKLLSACGKVVTFDYPYMAAGKKRPDPRDGLIASHKSELTKARLGHRGPIVLAGKSMGSRIGCHLSLEVPVSALVCFGYPLRSQAGKLRDEVLLQLRTPILFIQGSRDPLCPLDELGRVRARMTAPNELFVVEGADHSLKVAKKELSRTGSTQATIDARVLAVVTTFLDRHCAI